MVFSNTIDGNGIVQQTRDLCRVDSNQWATQKIVNSANNYLDLVAGYAIATDNRFQWDDTNHTKLPIGTTSITSSSDYSFLTDEQGNKIVTLTRIEYIDSLNKATLLDELDESEEKQALSEVVVSGTPTGYYKLSDNIIRLNKIPASGTLRFYFQRTPHYFTATDTTKEPGVSPLLHRGFVIASAYDCAITLGLPNTQALSVELQKETQKMITYFSGRNKDVPSKMTPRIESCR